MSHLFVIDMHQNMPISVLKHDGWLCFRYCKKRHNISEFIVSWQVLSAPSPFKALITITEKSTLGTKLSLSSGSPPPQLGWRMVHGIKPPIHSTQVCEIRHPFENDFHFLTNNLLRLICLKAKRGNVKKPPSSNLPQAPPTWLSPPSSPLLACWLALGRRGLHS